MILAALGERNVSDPNRTLAGHAEALNFEMDWAFVRYGVLKGEPAFDDVLETALAGGAGEIIIYPFFMSDGYFVTQVLPERIAAAGATGRATILPPLGLNPGLADVMMQEALESAGRALFDPGATRLLVVGRGSRSEPKAANAAFRTARELDTMGRFKMAEAAFLERPPFLFDLLASDKAATVISGFFAGEGAHSSHHIPYAIEESGASAVYAGPVGTSGAVRGLIAGAATGRPLKAS